MRDRQHFSFSTLAIGLLGILAFAGTVMVAQGPSAPGASAPAPRTPWGTPDLQGTWFVTEDVPLQRSEANAGREFLTDEEVAEADRRKAESAGRNTRSGDATRDVEGAYNAAFNSILKTGKRTSRIIDPPDGRIPPTVNGRGGGRGGFGGRGAAGAAPGRGAAAAGGGQAAGRGARGARGGGGRGFAQVNDNPEQIAQNPRCLGVQAPFLPLNTQFAQGTVMRIIQSRSAVTIYLEDDHAGGGNRVIYLDDRPHPPASLRLYLGDSRGRWEGDTLVVETTNFTQGFQGSTANLRMIERYRRVDANNLRREVTFDDPETWTRPWTVLIELGKVEDERHMIFESSCHEGNYGLMSILVGARLEERAAEAAAAAK